MLKSAADGTGERDYSISMSEHLGNVLTVHCDLPRRRILIAVHAIRELSDRPEFLLGGCAIAIVIFLIGKYLFVRLNWH